MAIDYMVENDSSFYCQMKERNVVGMIGDDYIGLIHMRLRECFCDLE